MWPGSAGKVKAANLVASWLVRSLVAPACDPGPAPRVGIWVEFSFASYTDRQGPFVTLFRRGFLFFAVIYGPVWAVMTRFSASGSWGRRRIG